MLIISNSNSLRYSGLLFISQVSQLDLGLNLNWKAFGSQPVTGLLLKLASRITSAFGLSYDLRLQEAQRVLVVSGIPRHVGATSYMSTEAW